MTKVRHASWGPDGDCLCVLQTDGTLKVIDYRVGSPSAKAGGAAQPEGVKIASVLAGRVPDTVNLDERTKYLALNWVGLSDGNSCLCVTCKVEGASPFFYCYCE